MDPRYTYFQANIKRTTSTVKRNCPVCRKLTGICDNCRNLIKFWQKALVSNLPQAKVEYLLDKTKKLNGVQAIEFDFLQHKLIRSKKYLLWQDILLPYTKKYKKVCEKGYSFLFAGKHGVGKTTALVRTALRFIKKEKTVHYITFPDLHTLNTKCSSNINDEDNDLFLFIKNVDLLIVDELGRHTNLTGPVLRLADTFLKSREESLKPTLLCSNLTIRQLDASKDDKKGYGTGFWSMLGERYGVFSIDPTTPDFRIRARDKWY